MHSGKERNLLVGTVPKVTTVIKIGDSHITLIFMVEVIVGSSAFPASRRTLQRWGRTEHPTPGPGRPTAVRSHEDTRGDYGQREQQMICSIPMGVKNWKSSDGPCSPREETPISRAMTANGIEIAVTTCAR
jgi:hypothetical protein